MATRRRARSSLRRSQLFCGWRHSKCNACRHHHRRFARCLLPRPPHHSRDDPRWATDGMMLTTDDILIRIEALEKHFGERPGAVRAVDGLHLAIMRGEFVTLTGPSGSGKSTVLNLLAGLDTPTKGEIVIDGQTLSSMTDEQLTIFRRRRLGIIFQFFNLLPTLTAAENVALPLRADRRPRAEIAERVGKALELVGMAHRSEE